MANFAALSEGQFVQIDFPRGGSVGGMILEIHLERPEHPWILLEQPTGAKTTIYENEVGVIFSD